jgi:acyl-CoA thioesterase-1
VTHPLTSFVDYTWSDLILALCSAKGLYVVRAVPRLLAILAVPAALVASIVAFRHMSSDGSAVHVRGDGRPAIVCLGDSLTAGDAAPADQSYPAWLQRKVDAAGYRFQVINAGHSGDRVSDGLARLQWDVLSYQPAIAIVELGSNDPGHTPADVWDEQLGTIVARLQKQHVAVILGGLDYPGMGNRYRSLGTRYGVPVVWFTAGLWSRPGLWGNAHHPNGAGYQIVMQSFWSDVVKALDLLKPAPRSP